MIAERQTQTWQEHQADTIDVKADTIDCAIIALERVMGIFRQGGEVDTHCKNTTNLLSVEVMNLRKEAENLRAKVAA